MSNVRRACLRLLWGPWHPDTEQTGWTLVSRKWTGSRVSAKVGAREGLSSGPIEENWGGGLLLWISSLSSFVRCWMPE